MAKGTKTAKRTPRAGQIVTPQPVDVGNTVPVAIKRTISEAAGEYELADGTVMRVKHLVIDIRRSLNKYNQQGDPIYLFTGGVVLNTEVPKRLKLKLKKGK